MTDDLRDVFGLAAAWRAEPRERERLLSGIPDGHVALYCPDCRQRFALPRTADPRFPPDLALLIYACDGCAERDAPEEVDQLWLDGAGYPVVPLPGIQ